MNELPCDLPVYSSGTKLSDVPPEFHGISYDRWLTAWLRQWRLDWLREHPAEAARAVAAMEGKHIWTPRDSYGMRGR